MKIAIPLAANRLCMHFGHCEEFALVEVDETTKTIKGEKRLSPPPHEPGVLPEWLHGQGASLIIAGGMGMRAQQFFNNYGIEVITGAPDREPGELVRAYLQNSLEVGDNVCDH